MIGTISPKVVILDANIICADYNLERPAFRGLEDYLSRFRAKLKVPEIAVLEIVNKWAEEARKLYKLSRRLGLHLAEDQPAKELKIDDLVRNYEQGLRNQINALGETIPVPEVGHLTLVQRCLRRHRPFTEDDSGYRDALIWASVLSEANAWTRLAFITADKHFMDKSRLGLHEDLKADVRQRELPDGCVDLYPSIKEFLIPFKETLDLPFDLLEYLETEARKIGKAVQEYLDRFSRDGFSEPFLSNLLEDPEVSVNQRVEIDDMHTQYSVDAVYYDNLVSFFGYSDWGYQPEEMDKEVTFIVALTLVFNRQDRRVENFELTEISSDDEDLDEALIDGYPWK